MTPDDVYSLVTARTEVIHGLVVAVIVMVGLLFLFATPASVIFVMQARRFNKILDLAELHGEITDIQAARMRAIAHDEFRHLLDVKHKVDEVDVKVSDVKTTLEFTAKEVLTAVGSPIQVPVDPNNPPRRRATDAPDGSGS